MTTPTATLEERLQALGERIDPGAIALPAPPTAAQAETIRRAAVVYALALAQMAELPVSGEALALEPHEQEIVRLYRATGQRYAYFDRRAANWLFGHVVSTIVGRPHDFAVVAPVAAWAIHALRPFTDP